MIKFDYTSYVTTLRRGNPEFIILYDTCRQIHKVRVDRVQTESKKLYICPSVLTYVCLGGVLVYI